MDSLAGALDRDSLVAVTSAILLILVRWVPAVGKIRNRWVPLAALLGLLLGSGVVRGFVDHVLELTPRDSEPSERLRYAVKAMERQKLRPKKNVLFVTGGSYPKRGLDSRRLERELGRQGYDVLVVHLAAGGFGHLERNQLSLDLTRALRRREILPRDRAADGQNWLLLDEVQRGYDSRPLANFDGVRDTARGYHFLSPSHALAAFRAIHWGGRRVKSDGATFLDLGRHALVQFFQAGIVDRLEPLRGGKSHDGFEPRGRSRKATFKGTARAIRAMRRAGYEVRGLDWLATIRAPMVEQTWGEHVDQLVYYALPPTFGLYVEHSIEFCRSTTAPCIASDDAKLYQKLAARNHWVDGAHLSKRGAKVYTAWFAKRLIALDVLER